MAKTIDVVYELEKLLKREIQKSILNNEVEALHELYDEHLTKKREEKIKKRKDVLKKLKDE